MNIYKVTLSIAIEAEDKIDAMEQVLELDVSDLDIETIEEN